VKQSKFRVMTRDARRCTEEGKTELEETGGGPAWLKKDDKLKQT